MRISKEQVYSKKTVVVLSAVLAAIAVILFWMLNLRKTEQNRFEHTSFAMGSFIQQTIYGGSGEETALKVSSAAIELENLISWRVENSDIAAINEAAGTEWLEADPQVIRILELALQVAEASEGAYDPTVLPISRLWAFDSEKPACPSQDELAQYLPYVDYRKARIDTKKNLVSLQNLYMSLDLGSAGKGAACDTAVEIYKNSHVPCAIIAVGGSVGTYGTKPDGSLWEIAVRNPFSETDGESTMGILSLDGGFLSTSGSYEKTFTENGITYHHLLDPATGMPADNELISVTIVSNNGALSDILSTACFVLGEEKGLALLDEFRNEYYAEAIFIHKDRTVTVTKNLQDSFSIIMEEFTYAQ